MRVSSRGVGGGPGPGAVVAGDDGLIDLDLATAVGLVGIGLGVRGHARRPLPIAEVPDRASTVGLPAEPFDELWAAVRALPDRQRHTVAYHHVAGLPYLEVAAIIGGTPEAARRAAADGIKNLRRALTSTKEAS